MSAVPLPHSQVCENCGTFSYTEKSQLTGHQRWCKGPEWAAKAALAAGGWKPSLLSSSSKQEASRGLPRPPKRPVQRPLERPQASNTPRVEAQEASAQQASAPESLGSSPTMMEEQMREVQDQVVHLSRAVNAYMPPAGKPTLGSPGQKAAPSKLWRTVGLVAGGAVMGGVVYASTKPAPGKPGLYLLGGACGGLLVDLVLGALESHDDSGGTMGKTSKKKSGPNLIATMQNQVAAGMMKAVTGAGTKQLTNLVGL